MLIASVNITRITQFHSLSDM